MSEFDVTQLVEMKMEGGQQVVTIDPHILYPATIERIQQVLTSGAFPAELIQNRVGEDGRMEVTLARATQLLANARQLPPEAWDDALLDRETFDSPIEYVDPKQRPALSIYQASVQSSIERLWNRGDALEVALGWFLQALRCRIGGSSNKILTGRKEGEERTFNYYQL